MERCTRWVVLLSVGMCIVALFAAGTTEYRSLQEKNVLIIGWDGVRRDRVQRMLDDGELPNLKKLVAQGSFVSTQVTAGETQTKPGWAEILTGYSSAKMGIYNNRNYQPIPKGYTIFERLKKHFGDAAIGTIFIGGKDYNIGARGPHEICINCLARDPITHKRTYANDIASFRNAGTIDGAPPQWVSRLGDPYFFSKDSIDVMTVGLGQAKNVAQSALAALNKYRLNKFIAFVHFEDPDEKGHLFGEQSSEYSDAIKNVDFWLGVIIKRLHGLGLSDRTSIYVTTDHGFDKGTFFHDNAPDTFLASNVRYLAASGDRLDVTPTILAGYGVDYNSFRPPLDGQSLSRD